MSTKKVKKKRLTVAQIKKLVGKPKTAPAALTSLEKLFSVDDRWIKGSEKDRLGGRCLIGGVHLVNGPSEKEVGTALALAIVQLYPKRAGNNKLPAITLNRAMDKVLGSYDFIHLIGSLMDYDSTIPAFNDHSDTEIKDVRKVIEKARTWVERFAEIRGQFDVIEEWKGDIARGLAKLFPKKKSRR